MKAIKLLSLLFVLLSLSSQSVIAQSNSKTLANSYVIHGNFDAKQLAFFKQSIESSDFEQYRLQDANLELTFKNGFKLELISAKDLTVVHKMQNVNPNLYKSKSDVPKGYVYPVFEINNAGWILALYTAQETKIKKP